ncbi:MAG: vWA domain-containing protein, partial [Flavobacteriales bacterium]
MIADITFKHPQLLWLGLIILPMIVYYILLQRRNRAEFRYSNVATSEGAEASIKSKLIHLPFVLRMLVVALLVVVLARPQSTSSWQDVTAEGIDIVMALDISGSMLAEDLKPNRLEASKKVAQTFIGNRPNDRLGLVVFAGESFTQCPLTTDHSVILNLFNDVKSGMLEDGT